MGLRGCEGDGADEEGMTMAKVNRVQVAIAETPASWQPESWKDVPPACRILEVVRQHVSESRAEAWMYGFNGRALRDKRRTRWAVALPDGAASDPGKKCRRRMTVCA